MSEQSKIAWCDSTLNFWEGCTKVSAGCANCYAAARDARQLIEKVSHWGAGAPRRKSKSAVKDAMAFNRKPWICDECGTAQPHDGRCEKCFDEQEGKIVHTHRRRIFSLSLGDWLDLEVPIEWLAEMLDTIRQCDHVTWILCTKRSENWRDRIKACFPGLESNNTPCRAWLQLWLNGKPPANIILLTSVENQEQADKRIPELLKIPSVCRGLSLEPLLGPVDLPEIQMEYGMDRMWPKKDRIKWLIIGGESGPNARPCDVRWMTSLVEQGKAAGVPTFVKQLGTKPYYSGVRGIGVPDGDQYVHKFPVTDKKGGDINE